uniref:Interferon-induced protein with tetratricopeptide repeats 5-like n=1 Tax=Seriola lalandi dorsalis TaxID=1841481 RepID=A0A3B4YI81_SERLL
VFSSRLSRSDSRSALHSRLLQLQSRFTWDLRKDDIELENLSTRLQDHIELQLGQRGAVARSYSFLAYVRYLQDRPKDAVSLLNQSEEKTRECYGQESEQRLIVTYGDLAWLKYHTGDYTQSESYCQRYPTGSSTVLHTEVYGEKAWTYLKFSRSYYPKAIDCFCKALELQPDDSEWNAGLAIALSRTEAVSFLMKSPATKQLRRALDINPDDGVLMSMLALKLVERALKIGPENPHVTRYIAKYLRSQGEIERSIDLLEKALKRTSQSAFLHHQLALCYKNKKIAEQTKKPSNIQRVKQWRRLCIHHLEEAVKIKTSFLLAIADLALLYGEEKDFSRAEELFQQGLKMLESESENSICQAVHQRYADFHFYHTKKEAEAIDHYTQVERRLSEDGNDGQAYALLAVLAKAEDDKKKAAEFYEKALDCDEDNDKYLSALCTLRMEL